MNIRLTESADLSALLAIYNDEVLNGFATFDCEPKTESQWADWFRAHQEKNHVAYTALIDGTPVGYSTLSTYRDRAAFDCTVELSVYVHRDYRGRGIGRALMERAIEHAKNDGSIVSVVSVITSSNEGSIRLHREFGFELAGRLQRVGIKHGTVLGVDTYQLFVQGAETDGTPSSSEAGAAFGAGVSETAPAAAQKSYDALCKELAALIEGEDDRVTNLANAASLIYNSLDRLNWAGFYLVKGDHLQLGPFMGKPACLRIPFGRGVCGTAYTQNQTQLVPDVHAFPGHIACDSASNSEIVVPLRDAVTGEVWGVLDIDSPVKARFTDSDKRGLERLAAILEGAGA